MKLSLAMKRALAVPKKGGSVVYLCTSSLECKPNIVPMRYVATFGDDKILMADMFLLKTKVNLKENPNCTVAIAYPIKADKGRWWAFMGRGVVVELDADPSFEWYGVRVGEVLKEWGHWEEREPPSEVPPDIVYGVAVQRGVLVVHVTGAYSIKLLETGKEIFRDEP
jgi:hypothetical protein